jgi:hydrogenase maturation protein HypF
MALEFAADAQVEEAYPLPLGEGTPAVADWEPLLRAVLADRAADVPVGRISARFHNALAELAVTVARRASLPRVVISGGCFQNALLGDRAGRRLSQAGFSVYTHRRVPPGDGGIALGQVWIALQQAQGASHVSGNSRQGAGNTR